MDFPIIVALQFHEYIKLPVYYQNKQQVILKILFYFNDSDSCLSTIKLAAFLF